MITEGIARGCRDNTGGVYQFYIATYPTLLDVTEDGTTKIISDITDGSTAVEYFPFRTLLTMQVVIKCHWKMEQKELSKRLLWCSVSWSRQKH